MEFASKPRVARGSVLRERGVMLEVKGCASRWPAPRSSKVWISRFARAKSTQSWAERLGPKEHARPGARGHPAYTVLAGTATYEGKDLLA